MGCELLRLRYIYDLSIFKLKLILLIFLKYVVYIVLYIILQYGYEIIVTKFIEILCIFVLLISLMDAVEIFPYLFET